MPVVPLVNWMLIASSNCSVLASSASARGVAVAARRHDVVEAEEAALLAVADADQRAQIGQALGVEPPGRRVRSISGASSRSMPT